MMRWGFWIELRGARRLWVASIVFVIVGALVVLAVPQMIQPQDRDVLFLLLRVLGGVFIILGLAVFLPMLASLFLAAERQAQWHWWINFIGGLLGALAFAVPATLMFPAFLVAYLARPNALVPDDAVAANNLGIAALFSVLGIIILIAVIWISRLKLREYPKRGV